MFAILCCTTIFVPDFKYKFSCGLLCNGKYRFPSIVMHLATVHARIEVRGFNCKVFGEGMHDSL